MGWWDPSEGNYLNQNASLSAFIRPMLPQAMLKCTNGDVNLQAALTRLLLSVISICQPFPSSSLPHFTPINPQPITNKFFFFLCMLLCGKNSARIWSALISYQVKTPKNIQLASKSGETCSHWLNTGIGYSNWSIYFISPILSLKI